MLELGIAEACESTGCRVRLIDGSRLEAAYAAPVQDRIKVRPGDMVAFDRSVSPPEVVWRWWHGTVERVRGGRAVVSRNHTQPTPEHSRRRSDELPVAGDLRHQLRAGDTVYFGSEQAGVVDVARDGVPSHPERFRAIFPAIVAEYERAR